MTEKQIQFLFNYVPKDNMFTSKEEIKLISETLGLNNMTYHDSLHFRNDVVKYYSGLMESEIILEDEVYKGRTDKFYDYMRAMQSVTTVIDHRTYKLQ